MLNISLKLFKQNHKKKINQVLYHSIKSNGINEIENLINNFLNVRNSFVFESVEKGFIKGRYTIFGKNPDKIWEFNNKNSYLIKNKKNPRIAPKNFGTFALDRKSIIKVKVRVKIIRGNESLSHNSIGIMAEENMPIISTIITKLRIFEPIIFPITIWFLPLKIAETVAASSGRLVPNAKIVKPTITSEIPIERANFSAYITAKFEPTTSSTKPIINIKKFFSISELLETILITSDRSFERITRK